MSLCRTAWRKSGLAGSFKFTHRLRILALYLQHGTQI